MAGMPTLSQQLKCTHCTAQLHIQESGEFFEGSTPTAALVSAALAQCSSQYVNGLEVTDPICKRSSTQNAALLYRQVIRCCSDRALSLSTH